MRELVRAYQGLTSYSNEHIRNQGLTPSQFEILSTLGNTQGQGMPFNKLVEETAIAKATLTGVIDRLEQKGLVRREVPVDDRRSFIAVLTPEGERVFNQTFPAHIYHLQQRFKKLNRQELEQIRAALKKLRELF
ncbi:MAG: MarR family transcriptional regulator [Desmonostoc vinosum HA7617-LM4]|nr:MarR family transcriptional regulator [Desmonostoc vinosum HA7617-LM4]